MMTDDKAMNLILAALDIGLEGMADNNEGVAEAMWDREDITANGGAHATVVTVNELHYRVLVVPCDRAPLTERDRRIAEMKAPAWYEEGGVVRNDEMGLAFASWDEAIAEVYGHIDAARSLASKAAAVVHSPSMIVETYGRKVKSLQAQGWHLTDTGRIGHRGYDKSYAGWTEAVIGEFGPLPTNPPTQRSATERDLRIADMKRTGWREEKCGETLIINDVMGVSHPSWDSAIAEVYAQIDAHRGAVSKADDGKVQPLPTGQVGAGPGDTAF